MKTTLSVGLPSYKEVRTNLGVAWRNSPATVLLVACCVGWFLLMQSITGHTPVGDVRAGALVVGAVWRGHIYEFVSSLFVHASWLHLLVNMISLWSLRIVEQIFRWRFFLVVYVLAGIVGNLISVFFYSPGTILLGASGAIFGIFGVILVMSYLGLFTKRTTYWIWFLLAVNLLFDLVQPQINILAHLGGLICGAGLLFLFRNFGNRHMVWKGASYVCIVLIGLAWIGVCARL
ncbi:rhomboid family intramembrane serine protease [Alicyclobacillus sp. TC]|uniref:Rhomboid protease GluP n=1 Tax=Alicyclobacillus tolerans TaxID=90970 RepID=A0A1M6V9H4_9BACL|nr:MULTISPECIES: rhomboid family intramembrane serine protease [Alicyclobacillus]QRF24126.1 rhomboid family intramembrane serine protease [Alicyclobacillus sp. TC]SHK78099.1 rhomboid protease GluP [Alicyclobacillus montanus]